jgi:glycolate oxidase
MDTKSVIEAMKGIVGPQNVIVDEPDIQRYSRDMADFCRRPAVVVAVTNPQQISKILVFASRNRIPVSPWGAGTSLTGAAVTDGILIDMSHMKRILKIDTTNWYVHVEAGATLGDLNRELEKHGFFFPPDPASSFLCTVGGAIAEGSGGLRSIKYGTVKDWVLALRVVLPDGRIMKLGEPLPKNRAGLDLVHLFVGSEGTLGVIVEAWLKIAPIPESRVVRMYATFDDWRDAGEAIVAIKRSRIVPRMLEFLDRESIQASNTAYHFGLPDAEALLLIDVEQFRGDEAQRITELLTRAGSKLVRWAESDEEAERLLLARSSVYLATSQQAPARMVEDVVVPIERMVEYLSKVRELRDKYGVRIYLQGHAGDGNIHPIILYDDKSEESRQAASRAVEELVDYAIQVGGSITGEHGVGVQKMKHLIRQLDAHAGPGALELMRRIKGVFDPQNIMNPGKYIDNPEPCFEQTHPNRRLINQEGTNPPNTE